MKKPFNRPGKVNKGAPSGFVISLVFHAAAFFIAGLFVVFTVFPKEEPEFKAPPPVARPKMNLKKPKVKIKKSAQPKPSSRIVAKVKTAKMPEIQIPDLVGTGEGLLAGIGLGADELMDIPDIAGMSVFGSETTTGNDFEGYFYDLKYYSSGNKSSIQSRYAGGDGFIAVLYDFLNSKMDPEVLRKYYRSPKKLYATTLCMPINLSLLAPASFGCPDTLGCLWLVHYKGKLVYHEDIRFRFYCAGDDIMSVMVDGEYAVQSMTWAGRPDPSRLNGIWYRDPLPFYYARQRVTVGDWIELKAGVPKDMEVVMAEIPGGTFQGILCVEVDGENYSLNEQGAPILPIFKTEPVSRDLADEIHSMSIPDEFCVTNGPIFSDTKLRKITYSDHADAPVDEAAESTHSNRRETRVWKIVDGGEVEGTLRTTVMDGVYLDTAQNESVKLLLEDLSEEDRKYVALENPPEFKIKFITGRNHISPPEQPPDTWVRPISINEYQFGLKLTQASSIDYSYPVTVEYFAIADEKDGSNYRLLEHCSSVFTPTKENGRSHTFRGNKLHTQTQGINPGAPIRGYDYCGSLVVISDERGRVIQYDASKNFLYPHLDALRKLKPGNHFNEKCQRVTPARPKVGQRTG